jgi:hypothetical protein
MIAVRHRAALVMTALAVSTAVVALAAPANAALPGFQVKISAPGQFKAGANAKTVEAVVSTDTVRRCQKVRWSMLLRVADGVTFDDVKVTRIENGAEFALQSQIGGDTARLTDVQFDPGQLCRGSTVTSRYDISFAADSPAGRITYQIQALNAASVVLQEAAATSEVAGGAAAPPKATATPTPTPSKNATPTPEPSESDDAGAGAAATDDPTDDDAAVVPTAEVQANTAAGEAGVPSLLGPGLIVGALFVFVGSGILLRLRLRSRAPKGRPMPTSFYPTR